MCVCVCVCVCACVCVCLYLCTYIYIYIYIYTYNYIYIYIYIYIYLLHIFIYVWNIYIYIYTNQHKSCFTPVAWLKTYTIYKADLDTEMNIYIYISGFYLSTFVYSRFFSKTEFLYCLLSQYLLRYPNDGQWRGKF